MGARRPDPHERRVKIVAFAPAGLLMLDRFREGVAEAEWRMAEAFGQDVLDELKARLKTYVKACEAESPAAASGRRSGPEPRASATYPKV